MKLIFNLTVFLLLVGAAVTQPLKVKAGAPSSNAKTQTARTVAPGIEYYDEAEPELDQDSDKMATVFDKENIYKKPHPQLAKISDVITKQGPTFHAAITNHLIAPLSIYTSKRPTSYEISAPIPAQLAYTEKITYQPQFPQQFTEKITYQPPTSQHPFEKITYKPQFPQQFTEKITYKSQTSQHPQNSEEGIKYQPQFSQHLSEKIAQQPQSTQQQNTQDFAQNETPNLQLTYQQSPYQAISRAPLNPQAEPIQYNPLKQAQSPLVPIPIYLHPQFYNQAQFPFQNPLQLRPQPLQYVPLPQQITKQLGDQYATANQENLLQQTDQTFNNQKQGAFSYASFSVGPTVSLQQQYQPKSLVQQHLSTPQVQQNNLPQVLPQIQQYQSQQNPQPYQLQTQPQVIHYSTQIPSYQPQQQTQSQQDQYQEPEQYRTYSTEIPSYQHQFREPEQKHLEATENKKSEPSHQNRHQYDIQREPPPSISMNRYHQEIQQRLSKKFKPFFVNPIRIQPKNAQPDHISPLSLPLSFSHNNDQAKKYYRPDPEVQITYNPLNNDLSYHNNFPAQRLLSTTTLAPIQFHGKYAREIFLKYRNRVQ